MSTVFIARKRFQKSGKTSVLFDGTSLSSEIEFMIICKELARFALAFSNAILNRINYTKVDETRI